MQQHGHKAASKSIGRLIWSPPDLGDLFVTFIASRQICNGFYTHWDGESVALFAQPRLE